MSNEDFEEGSIEKLDFTTPNFADQNIARIAELFPNVVTETRDKHGKVHHAIDFDALKQELSDEEIVDGPQERYHLNWPGKRKAMLAANAPINKTLRPKRDESVDFDTTKNLFIEGDNLDALKLLQETYLGKVKMIYIDPPYNTGKDFIYKDNFTVDKDEYLEDSGQRDEDGGRLVANPESNGRYHSDWLSMMYPRLKLARNLLRDDGVIFISIDAHEASNLEKLAIEIFGQNNFLGRLTWKARRKPVNIGEAKFRPQNETDYVLVFQKTYEPNTFKPLISGSERSYPHELDGRRYRLTTILKSNRGANRRETMVFSLGKYTPPEGQRWQAGKDEIDHLNSNGFIEFCAGTPFRRYFEDEEGAEHDPFYCYMDQEKSSSSEAGKSTLNGLIGDDHGFDTVKPIPLLRTLLQSTSAKTDDHIVLDFFAGSATTAHAVFEENIAFEKKISFILVQENDEPLENSAFENVAELGKYRIVAAGKSLLDKHPNQIGKLDVGFRVLKIDSSNMSDVWHSPENVSQDDLLSQISNIKADRNSEDLLFQVLLDWGVDLSLPITREKLEGKDVFFVDGNALAACFETGVTEELVKAIAARAPLRAVFREDGFADDNGKADSTRINVGQLFKHLSPNTELKVI